MPDEDRQGHNGGYPGDRDEPVSPFAPPPPPPLGSPLPASAPPEASAPPVAPSAPPGYTAAPDAAANYQAPAPWVPASFPPPSASSPFGPPPVSPVVGSLGLANGAPQRVAPRKRRRVLATIVAIIVVLALVGGGVATFTGSGTTVSSPPSTVTSPAARQLLQAALQAAGRVDSFHYVASSSLSGKNGGSSRTVGDAGPNSGRQLITSGTQKFTVLVIGTACYLKGNASALVGNLDFSASDAATHAGQWISLARSDAPYATVYAAVTAPAAIADNVTIVPRNQLAPSTLDGRRVETVTGAIAPVKIPGTGATPTPKGTATLEVRASTPHLPVRYTERGTVSRQQSTATVSFTKWGEPVHFTAPAGAIPWAQVGAGSGPISPTPSGTFLT